MSQAGSAVAAVPSDAVVIERSWNEPHHFAEVFDRHAPHIHRYVARRLGREAADDLTAETFLAAFGRRRHYDVGRRDARPWLYGIATNLIGQHRRDEVRRYRLALLPAQPRPEDCPAERVAAGVTAEGARGALSAALAELSDDDRDVLLLIAWEQLTYEEVAAALRVPVGTVRSRLNRARRKVRSALGADPTIAVEEPA
jgi:RNA polymerase sigma factor (sigma-70 family)